MITKWDGGDVDENRNYIEGKWVAHGQKFSIKIFEYHKMALLFRWTKFEIEKQNMSGNFEDHKMALLFRWTKFEIQNKTCHYNFW